MRWRYTVTKAVFGRVRLIATQSRLPATAAWGRLLVGIRGQYHPSNPSPLLARMGRAYLAHHYVILYHELGASATLRTNPDNNLHI